MLSNRTRTIPAFAVACVLILALAPQALLAQHAQSDQVVSGLQVQVTSVARTPTGAILVKWTYHNTTGQTQTVAAGCYLEANGSKYPASVSSITTKSVTLNAGQTLAAWAVVADPGANVGKVTVHINGAAPVTDVAVSSG